MYTADFIHTEQAGYNQVLGFGNMLENHFEFMKTRSSSSIISPDLIRFTKEWTGKACVWYLRNMKLNGT